MKLQVVPYVMLNGTAAQAIADYEKLLGATIVFRQTFGEGPQPEGFVLDEEQRQRIAHAVLQIGETQLMVADSLPSAPTTFGTAVNLCLLLEDPEEAARLYEVLSEGGTIIEKLQAVYFSPAYAMITDRYGVTFQLFTKRPS
ncbi:VOC family protein [Paenibacillus sp. 1P07SE]|uniref:VOC family protein n=1 Tax=Paenibacillus sp. 1P07SE TaxID=3132209 RepID=UPI0039A5626A